MAAGQALRRRGCAPPNCASRRASRTSTIAPPAVSIAPCSKSSRGRMDRRPRQSGSRRPDRRRQKLAGLRHRPQSLPRQSVGPLSSLAEALRGSRARPRRRAPSAPHQSPRPRRSSHPRRFGLEPLDAGARHDLLEILEERYGRRSTIVTSQLPIDRLARGHRRADAFMMPPSWNAWYVADEHEVDRSARPRDRFATVALSSAGGPPRRHAPDSRTRSVT